MKRILITITAVALRISATSCQKTFEGMRKSFQTTDRNYQIEQYSGGVLIKTWEFRGILNDSEGSDGYYFYDGRTLVELSGDLVIMSTK